MALLKDGRVVGHLPKKQARIYLFMRRSGVIRCCIAGSSADLPQGGLEIPCVLVMEGQSKGKELKKVKALLNLK